MRPSAHLLMLTTWVVVSIRVALAGGTVGASPPTAEQRYEEGRRLMQQNRFAEAAAAYKDVAESNDAPMDLRGQALFASGLMWESARDYERAGATYDEVQRRFPDSEPARRATVTADALRGGSTRWLEFRRRQDEAWDQLSPAEDLAEREGLRAARPALERAASLLDSLLRDFGDNPNAKDVALALGNTHMILRRFSEAGVDYRRAIALASAKDEKTAQQPPIDNFVLAAEHQLSEAIRAVRRQRLTRGAYCVLGVISVALLGLGPWRAVDGPMWRLGGCFMLGTLLLAVIAAAVAYYLGHYVDGESPVTTSAAGLLVALPGVVGQAVALAFVDGLRGKLRGSSLRGVVVAGTLGATAAFAVTVCLVNAFALFPFLDSKL